MEISRSVAWYRRFEEYFSKAFLYLLELEFKDMYQANPAVLNFDRETMAQLIFESNNLEREGLPRGETKELVFYEDQQGNFPDFKKEKANLVELSENCQIIQKQGVPINFVFPDIDSSSKNEREIEKAILSLIARYKDKSREAQTVVQHYAAARLAENWALKMLISRVKGSLYSALVEYLEQVEPEKGETELAKLEHTFPEGKPKILPLLTEERIRQLHRIIAKNLTDERNAPAGDYRTRPIMTDLESHYPAPEDLPAAMQKFIRDFEERETHFNPIKLAAWASTQFVLIHPFSDFNGRVSRLILNMVLRSYGVPFWVSMRSTAKDRKRYLKALVHYREGKIYSVPTLISMQLVHAFDALNSVLALSNYPQMDISSEMAGFPVAEAKKYYHLDWHQEFLFEKASNFSAFGAPGEGGGN